jgi:hypothetical protein
MNRYIATAATLGAIALAACSDSTAPGTASLEDREEILQLLEESGFFADEFGVEGAIGGSPAAQPAALFASPGEVQADVTVPDLWGRRHRRPVRRVITVDVDLETGIATVSKEVEFLGEFILDNTDDGQFNPTHKPMRHTLLQYAQFERLPDDGTVEPPPGDGPGEPNDGGPQRHRRRWRLVALSPAEWVMTEPTPQTVTINRIQVEVDGELALEVTDPSELFVVDGRVPVLHPGQMVTVKAWVEGGNAENNPPLFAFLHMFHASPDTRVWMRRQMTFVDDHYEFGWEVQHTGRERVAVDVIDSQAFATASEDDYRANVWGIPYVIE